MTRICRFTVSRELIIQALKMPENSKIHRVVDSINHLRGDVEFYVEHDSLNEVKECETIPWVTPMITKHTHACQCHENEGKIFETFEWDWGLENA